MGVRSLLHYAGPEDRAQVVSLGSRHLYPADIGPASPSTPNVHSEYSANPFHPACPCTPYILSYSPSFALQFRGTPTKTRFSEDQLTQFPIITTKLADQYQNKSRLIRSCLILRFQLRNAGSTGEEPSYLMKIN